MKKLISFLAFALLLTSLNFVYGQGAAINTTGASADASAILDVSSTSQGVLIPRMTMVQRNAIATPAHGLMIYQTDNTAGFYYNSGTTSAPVWTALGTDNLGNHTATTDLDMDLNQVKNVANATDSMDAVNVRTIQKNELTFANATGSSNAYALSLSPAVGNLKAGMIIHFKANFPVSGAATLNVNGLGAVSIKKYFDQDLATNDIKNGQMVSVIYDGTNFQMLSQTGNAPSGGSGSGGDPTLIYTTNGF